MSRVRSDGSSASCGVFAHWRRITSAPTWITTCQCFFSGFHSTLAEPVCVIIMLQPQITRELREREGFSGVPLRQSGPDQQRVGVGVAAHESTIQFGGVLAVAPRQYFAAEFGADLAAEDTAIAETREGVRLQHLGPF